MGEGVAQERDSPGLVLVLLVHTRRRLDRRRAAELRLERGLSGHAIEAGVVRFAEHRDAPALEALDDGALPKRARAVELRRVEMLRQARELRERAGRRQTVEMHVAREIDVRVRNPDRVIETERRLVQVLVEVGEHGQPLAQVRPEALEEVFAALSGLEDLNGGRVHRRGRCLRVEECRVERTRLMFVPPKACWRVSPPREARLAPERSNTRASAARVAAAICLKRGGGLISDPC